MFVYDMIVHSKAGMKEEWFPVNYIILTSPFYCCLWKKYLATRNNNNMTMDRGSVLSGLIV